jgi:DNA-binding response OmpR family regulator
LLYPYLEREGYQVSTAADQAEVGLMIEAQRPDLLILDLDTPDGPDFTTFAQLRANPTTSDIPILVLSIHNVQAQGLALGAAGALMKPVEQQELLDQAHLALNSAASDVALQRVVVADTDLESRVLLAGGLRWGGYEVIETADGASTLAACQQQPPDLLLLASQFPDQSGLAILQQLRDNAGTNQTNIIMLMADPEHDEANREQFAALGATLQPRPTMTPLQAATLTDHQEG